MVSFRGRVSFDNFLKVVKAEYSNTNYMKSLFPIFVILIAATACHGQESDTLDALSYSNSSATKVQNGDYYGAWIDVEKSIAMSPKWAPAYDIRGLIKEHTGDLDGALSDFTTAIELYPRIDFDTSTMRGIDIDAANAYYNRAGVELKMQDYKAAKSDYSKSIKILSSPEAYFGIGMTELFLNDKDSGCADLKQAMDRGYKPAEEYIKVYCH